MRYLVVIEEGPNSQGVVSYSAFSPDVLGCVATGKTREEVERRMQSALQSHIEWMVEDNDPLPEPHTAPDDPDIAGDPTLTPIYMDIPIPHRAA
ncbi:MAG TPA: type II toxin-antitoxin system HicB family antitoxin [Ktedonobacteraceae bacterium]|nr:type II toxin-antitoxin system HicB family antitoxin [Ktedonobacteraceae bacterium]